jgi:hypothetical protein
MCVPVHLVPSYGQFAVEAPSFYLEGERIAAYYAHERLRAGQRPSSYRSLDL